MKKAKKIITVLTLLGMSLFTTNAYAETWKVHNEGRGFTSAWEAQEGDSNFGFVYGYNTTWINEDYCHSIYSRSHNAAIANANGGYSSNYVSGGKWAKIEVRHAGSSVMYGMGY